jgi:BirA family biotin operon repressor/biotin-[acetyl-CoA-carboxylase] ligase
LLPAYRSLCATIGARVQVELPGGVRVAGTAGDVDSDGGLVVDTGDTLRVVTAGDVVHLR